MNDAELHAAALAYAKKFNTDYLQAAKAVVALEAVLLAGKQLPSAPAVGTGKPLSDAELDAQATVYAKANGISYSEAIGAVCGQAAKSFEQMTSFSEAWDGSGGAFAARSLEGQQIEIFRAGRHTSDDGQALDFSASDIRAMVSAYAPTVREAPLVVGHPQNNHPAYGWVKGLTATDDGRLLARTGQVSPEFAKMVQEGRFKKRSASFYPPNHPGNPRPGNWYLRHVGWLGAQQPALAGLKDIAL